jgi:L-threonylcarbamoyladenylate synthase
METRLNVRRMTERLGVAGVARGAEILKAGGLVAFPTETVYGLGANALDGAAVASIFAAKERPGWDPVIVHVADRAMVDRVAVVSVAAERLMEAFWPGPLTLLLPRTASVPDNVTAGRELVGVRMPAHPLALELIRMAGTPIAAPSANRFGHTSPTTAAHVLTDLDGRIDAVMDGGPTEVGVESTVVDPGQNPMLIYRPGGVTAAMVEAVLGVGSIRFYVAPAILSGAPEGLPSPGVGIRHYAPKARMILVRDRLGDVGHLQDALGEAVSRESGRGARVGVMLPESWDSFSPPLVYAWGPWGDSKCLARRLFAGLRELDEAGATAIVCPVPASDGLGAALRDRLEKAAR